MNKLGRNDKCPCGSGKKYKQCCLKKTEDNFIIGDDSEMQSLLTVNKNENSLIDEELLKIFIPIFNCYDFFDLSRAIFAICAWRGNRPELIFCLTLNKTLEECMKDGTQEIKNYTQFESFFNHIKSHYKKSAFVDENIPDWGEVFITYNENFYPIFLGNGYNFVFATMQCLNTVARILKYEDKFEDILIYVKTMIDSLSVTNILDNDKKFGDLYQPSFDFFNAICSYYKKFNNDEILNGIKELLLKPIAEHQTQFIEFNNAFYPLFNASIIIDAYSKLLEQNKTENDIAKFIIYNALQDNFCVDPSALLIFHAGVSLSESKYEILDGYNNGILIAQGNYSILFLSETNKDSKWIKEFRTKIKKLHNDDNFRIAGIGQDKNIIELQIPSSCNFEVISFDEIINCSGTQNKKLLEDELFKFFSLELIYLIYSAKNIEELYEFILFSYSEYKFVQLSYDGRCALFEVWKQNNRQITQGALQYSSLFLELNFPEWTKWEKYKNDIVKFYPKQWSYIFTSPENWSIVYDEHNFLTIENKGVNGFGGYIRKSNNSYIFLEYNIEILRKEYKGFSAHQSLNILTIMTGIINRGFYNYWDELIKNSYFPENSGIHALFIPQETAKKYGMKQKTNKYLFGECRISNGIYNIRYSFNMGNFVKDIQCINDRTVECILFLEFIEIIKDINCFFNYNDIKQEILSHCSETKEFTLKLEEIKYYVNENNYCNYPDNIAFTAVKKQIAELCYNQNIERGIYEDKFATNIIRKIQAILINYFESKIKQYNQQDLHERLLSKMAYYMFGKHKNTLTYSFSKENITTEMQEIAGNIASQEREECKNRIRNISYLIETNLFLIRNEFLCITDEQLNYILAFADWLVVLQDVADGSFWELSRAKIEVEDDYRVSTVHTKEDKQENKNRIKRYYENSDYFPSNIITEADVRDLVEAIENDIGINLSDILLIYHYFEFEFSYTFKTNEKYPNVFIAKKTDLIKDIYETVIDKSKEVQKRLLSTFEFLTIDKTQIKTTYDKKKNADNIHPILPIWERENRWNRIDIKPFVKFSDSIIFSPVIIHDIKEMWMNGLIGLFPPIEAKLFSMQEKIKKLAEKCQKQMEIDVANLFSTPQYKTEKSFEFIKREKNFNHEDVGDYDVIAIDTTNKIIFNIESKFLHKVANIFEAANQQKGFFEQNKFHEKFQRRIEYLKKHKNKLFKILGIDDNANEYDIKNYMVTNKVFYSLKVKISFQIISYDELKRLLKMQ